MTSPHRTLAAVTLAPQGGGIAAVSRLLWRVFEDRWPADCSLVTLLPEPRLHGSSEVPTIAKISFGAHMASAQLLHRTSWVLYSHLSLAKVQKWLPRGARRPYAIFLHGIEAWRGLSVAEHRLLRDADLLIANSSYTARRIKIAHPWIASIAECELALPDHVADIQRDGSARTERRSTRPTVMIVARMSASERYKGHDQLVDAWPAVRSRVPDARLLIVGDGDDAPRLRAKAADLGLGESVVFTGFVSDERLDDLYAQASVFAMPSREEGFGLVYLEAMRRGLPCVGSVHDAAGGIILDGITGYLVDQSDVTGLSDRLVRLLSDPSRCREMGERGRLRVEQHFSYERFKDTLIDLLAGAFAAVEAEEVVGQPMSAGARPRS